MSKSLRRAIPNANALLVFESAARLGGFTRAAEELGVSQPSVTHHVRTVEAMAGQPLFERRNNRLILTEAGRRLLASVQQGFGEVAEALDALKAAGPRPRLTLTVHPGFAQHWLIRRFDALRQVLGGYDIRLAIADSPDAPTDPTEVDLAILVGRGPWAGRRAHRLVTETVEPVAAPALLAADARLAAGDPTALRAAPLLHMDQGDEPWMTWADWFRARGLPKPPAPRVLYNNYPLVLQEALAGRGVALAWRPLADELLATGALARIGPAVENPAMGYHLVWRNDAETQPVAEAVCDWLLAALSERSPAPAADRTL
ncbi:MAG: LysR substrate-binding domain-containing protein [Alphaproteobacteria bacterium]|nr:LysR substrate-binding domain-containing protein [Alphaproteobacteria bacterium]